MSGLRKFFIIVLGILLFTFVIGGALTVSTNKAFRTPEKVEKWLDDSGFYDHFVDNELDKAAKTDTSQGQPGAVSLTTPSVKQAAKESFTPAMMKQDVETFLNANYAWLQGKTTKPEFNIDVTQAKELFATNVGNFVERYMKQLPVCTQQELQQIQLTQGQNATSVDPFTLSCRPANLSPEVEAKLVTERLRNNDNFLNAQKLTADSPQLTSKQSNQPYYKEFSALPTLYKLQGVLPWVYLIASIVCLVGIIVLCSPKRLVALVLGVVLLAGGGWLVGLIQFSDQFVQAIEKMLVDSSMNGPLQQSLTTFLHTGEKYVMGINWWFALAYLLVGVVLLVVFFVTRPPKKESLTPVPGVPTPGEGDHSASLPSNTPLASAGAPQPPETRPPRLIQ